jgi:LysR family transcriptional regulator (chromosome initiation inhibitor)
MQRSVVQTYSQEKINHLDYENISFPNNSDMRSFDADALECLAAIVEEGGFERAAVRLSVTQSAVSQRLRALEAQVGTVLLVRSRPIRPTTAGRLLIKHAMQLRLLRADLDSDLQEMTPGEAGAREEERISIAINADSIATWALPALGPLVSEGLPLEIITDDQDFTHEWLREGQVMGCVTTLKQALRGCNVVPLGAMPYVAVAGAAYAQAQCPQGLTAHNFRQIPFIAFNRKDDLQTEFVGRALGLRRVSLHQRFVPSSEGQVRAALAGWGATVVPQQMVQPYLEAGTLVNVALQSTLEVNLYWHCWNLQSAVIDRLTRAVMAAAQQSLLQEKKSKRNPQVTSRKEPRGA